MSSLHRTHVAGAIAAALAVTTWMGASPANAHHRSSHVRSTETTTTLPTTTTTIAPSQAGICSINPADGQVAITAAIKSCPDGSTVLFPAGRTYSITDSIRVERRTNLTIDGNGSSFNKVVVTTPGEVHPNWLTIDNHGFTLKNMTVQGTFTLAGPRDPGVVGAMGPNQFDHGVAVFGSRDVLVADLTVTNTFGDLIYVGPTGFSPWGSGYWHVGEVPTNVRVQRLVGRTAARQGVAVTGAEGFWLTDSDLRDCWYWCVDLEADVADEPLRNVHVLNNTFAGSYFGYITVPAAGTPGAKDGFTVRGNRMIEFSDPGSCSVAIQITYWPDTGYSISNVTVEDNYIKAASFGITYRDVRSGSIQRNTLERAQDRCGPAAGLDRSVELVNTSGVTVGGNSATGWG